MTTMIFIENSPGSGHPIMVIEDFGRSDAQRTLAPGDNVRVPLSQFKAIVIAETEDGAAVQAGEWRQSDYAPYIPRKPLKLY
ncbi:hypothetical protein BH11PSE2_BH11PSE2_21920 [soil metagenome]